MGWFNKNTFIKYTVPSVMLLIICLQYILIRTVYISPWKGGGFGMFSTVNTPVSHIVRVFNYNGTGEKIPVILPEKFEAYERNIRHIATGSNISLLKNAMKKQQWFLKNLSIVDAEDVHNGNGSYYPLIELNKIKIELWGYHFDLKSKKYYSTFIAEF